MGDDQLVKKFNDSLVKLIADAKSKARDGLTLREFGELLGDFVTVAVNLARLLGNPGSEKKQIVLNYVGQLFDVVIATVPLPLWLAWLKFFTPQFRRLVLGIADGLIEAVYARLRELPLPSLE